MLQIHELVGYYLGWVKPGKKDGTGGPNAMVPFFWFFFLCYARDDLPEVKIRIVIRHISSSRAIWFLGLKFLDDLRLLVLMVGVTAFWRCQRF
jgi:hypothetical protein